MFFGEYKQFKERVIQFWNELLNKNIQMNQNQGTLLAFLKKNAAHSTGTYSSKRDSDIKSSRAVEADNSFQPMRNNQHQFSGQNRPKNVFDDGRSVMTFGSMGQQNQNSFSKQNGRTMGRPQDDLESIKSFQSEARSIRTTTTNFQNARSQAQYCINNLSEIIKSGIHDIDRKMDSFNQDVLRQLKQHSQMFRKRVNVMIDEVFRQNERHLFQIQRFQQQKMGSQLLQIRKVLQNQYVRVEMMKSQISQSNWKKVAGDLFSNQIEQKVLALVEKSQRLLIRVPDWTQKTNQSIRQIQDIVRQNIRLR